jgi:hypothetical protein
MRGAANLGKLIFHDVSDAALQALASGGDRRALHGAVSKDRDIDRDRARDVASPGLAHDALMIHLVEVPIELGNDLVTAQLLLAALLGGVSDHYRFLHGLIVGDQRGLSAAYGKLASGSARATAPGEHQHRRSENEQDKSHELKTAAVTANHQIADATTMPAIGPSLSITRG